MHTAETARGMKSQRGEGWKGMPELGNDVEWVGLNPRGHLGLLFRARTRVSRVRGLCVEKLSHRDI